MRYSLLIALCTFSFSYTYAQFPTSIPGLGLRLDAATGYNDNGTAPATWLDQSGGVTLTSGTLTNEPTYTASAAGTGYPGILFDGNDYLARPADTVFKCTSATLFVVRIANTVDNTITPGLANIRTTLSIGEGNSFHNEFCLTSNWAIHHSSSGNWLNRKHQCYNLLPDSLPAIISTRLRTGVTLNDIDYYVNAVPSTEAVFIQTAPWDYPAVNRSVVIGARYRQTPPAQEFFQGYILEVIAYNRVLTNAEMDSVHKYLKCKYKINYLSCNSTLSCETNTTIGGNTTEPLTDKLMGCTPNPFSNRATLAYNLVSMKETAAIIVYDATRRKLRTLPITANGRSSIVLNADDMPAGLYLCALVVDGRTKDISKVQVGL